MPTKTELVLINSAVDILAEVCTAPPEKVIEWLTEKLWDELEAYALLKFRLTTTCSGQRAGGDLNDNQPSCASCTNWQSCPGEALAPDEWQCAKRASH